MLLALGASGILRAHGTISSQLQAAWRGSSLSTARKEEFPQGRPVVLTYRKLSTCAPCMHWLPGLLRAAKRYFASYMSPANSDPQCAWKLLGNLCSRHPRSRECSSRGARDAGWGSWRDRDNGVLNLNFTFMRLSLPFAALSGWSQANCWGTSFASLQSGFTFYRNF